MVTLQERLDRGEVVILDGATGTELQRRGVPMHGVAWSAAALMTHPETVRAVHEDYIRAGADVITTNSFSTARHLLEKAGMGDRVRELNTRAVTLAREAREGAARGRPVFIAGSMSTMYPGADARNRPDTERAQILYREQAELLAAAGVDLIALEMMQDIELATCAATAAVATGLPAWIGFSCKPRDDEATLMLLRGHPFGTALDAILPLGGSAVTVMHTLTQDIAPALRMVMARWSGPVGAYAHSGDFVMPNWQWVNMISPEDYAAEAMMWVAMGTQIIGGCCGIGPEYIRLLKERLPTHVPPVSERRPARP
ncbi:MAG: homocysteine S-methyltransferase family protein [Candidatus Rokuibacteriota bacterium]